jgi:hypothetical protein
MSPNCRPKRHLANTPAPTSDLNADALLCPSCRWAGASQLGLGSLRRTTALTYG